MKLITVCTIKHHLKGEEKVNGADSNNERGFLAKMNNLQF